MGGTPSKTFFFEKKNQKNFSNFAPGKMGAKSEKSFCFFFFRKRRIFRTL